MNTRSHTRLSWLLGVDRLVAWVSCGLFCWSYTGVVLAQNSARLPGNTYHLLNASAPPGSIAAAQVAGRRPGVGTYTAVSITGSPGLKIGLARDGQFLHPITAPVTTGMLVGAVYRFHVTNIPDRPGEELFPTLEIIGRTNPEPGREHRFPIPVLLTDEDLQLALEGSLVTRVIYLEDSEVAEPVATKADSQLTVDVGPTDNALQTADVLGKPLAILRIGSRVPTGDSHELMEFLYGCPPWVPLAVAPDRDALIREGKLPEVVPAPRDKAIYPENPGQDFPRIPLDR